MDWLCKKLFQRAERLRTEGWLESTMAHRLEIEMAYKARDEYAERVNKLRSYCFNLGGNPDLMYLEGV